MTKFFAIVSPVIVCTLLAGWASAATPSTSIKSKSCIWVTESDGTSVRVCSK